MGGFRQFVESHWGDLLAIYFFHLGIGLIVLSWKVRDADLDKIGWSLFTASMATMRFKGYLNGGTTNATTTNGTSTTPSATPAH
jgi:hypothetical protein